MTRLSRRTIEGAVTPTKELGAIVRQARMQLKLRQDEAARILGVGTRFLSDLENGKETLQIGKALQVLEKLGYSLAVTPTSDREAYEQGGIDQAAGFVSDHRRLDARSLEMHKVIAQKLKKNPELIEKARQNIRQWKEQSPSLTGALDEWEQIINQGIDKTIAFMCDPGEEATRLRQSTPFTGYLKPKERWRLYGAFRPRTYHPGRR